jgi:hypothetical protein
MFDYVRAEFPLPNAKFQAREFQTKDGPREPPWLATYTIRTDGRLSLKDAWDGSEELIESWTGEMVFYDWELSSGVSSEETASGLHYFRAIFSEGRLVRIEDLADRDPSW